MELHSVRCKNLVLGQCSVFMHCAVIMYFAATILCIVDVYICMCG